MTNDVLVSSLYASANGRMEWKDALGKLAEYFDLWLVQVVGVDRRNGNLIFTAYGGPGSTPEAALDYVRFYNTVDPRIGLMLAAPLDQWADTRDVHDDNFIANNPFYRDFLVPHGGEHMLGTKLLEVGNTQFLLGMVGHPGQQPIPPSKVPVLHQLKHHLTEAFRNLVHLRETYAELDMAQGLLDQFDYPMLVVDENCSLGHFNDSAARLLKEGGMLVEQGGYLVCRDRTDEAVLAKAIHGLQLSALPGSEAPARRVVTFKRRGGSACVAFVSAVRSHQTMGVFGHASRALIVIHDPARSHSTLDPFIVAECFDLTPAEARVAVQIAEGANAKEIAKRSGAALATVRTHIKRVMEKTGVDRQGDLIRLLLALPTRGLKGGIGPGPA